MTKTRGKSKSRTRKSFHAEPRSRALKKMTDDVDKVLRTCADNLAGPEENDITAQFFSAIFIEGMLLGSRFAETNKPFVDMQTARCIGNAFVAAMRATNQRRAIRAVLAQKQHELNCPDCAARPKTMN